MTDDTENKATIEGIICPTPLEHGERIVLGHGSGGKMTFDLIRRSFMPAFDNAILATGNDAAVTPPTGISCLVISTDSHVVNPLVFPGGNIGKLAICGTVNDLTMMGAKPLYMTVGFVLEEGVELDLVDEVGMAMRNSADEAGIAIVAGDTKVVEKGKADGMYISTAGIGVRGQDVRIGGEHAQAGDAIILSGPIGDHGIAVLSARGELGFDAEVESDVAPLNQLVAAMMKASDKIHVLRDPTRGGVATSLNEIARQSRALIVIEEQKIPVRPAVQSACELLGFDPLYIANEGKLLAFVAAEDAQKVLRAMRENRYGEEATIIGEVKELGKARVLAKNQFGSHRVLDMLMGEMLPRIC